MKSKPKVQRSDMPAKSVYPISGTLTFKIGAFDWRLLITDRALFSAEGDELEGVAIEGRKLMLLSFKVSPERRLEVAYHEYQHAWEFHVPAPTDAEERCQFAAFLHGAFTADLDRQGGEVALMNLIPSRVPHLGRPKSEMAQTHAAHDLYVSAALGAVVTAHLSRGAGLDSFDFDAAVKFAGKLSRRMVERTALPIVGYAPARKAGAK